MKLETGGVSVGNRTDAPDIHLVEKEGCTSCGFLRSDQNTSSRSNSGLMSATYAFPSGKIRRTPPCSCRDRAPPPSMKSSRLPRRLRKRQSSAHLHVPVLVQVVDAGEAASVAVRVVHMFDVTGSVSGVTRHHGLRTGNTREEDGSEQRPGSSRRQNTSRCDGSSEFKPHGQLPSQWNLQNHNCSQLWISTSTQPLWIPAVLLLYSAPMWSHKNWFTAKPLNPAGFVSFLILFMTFDNICFDQTNLLLLFVSS